MRPEHSFCLLVNNDVDAENEKKEEMVIGLPTDVKHVAHIGNDGPSSSSSTPSWVCPFLDFKLKGKPSTIH